MTETPDGYEVHQLGVLWYVTNSRASLRSQGYLSQELAERRRAFLEQELILQRPLIQREKTA